MDETVDDREPEAARETVFFEVSGFRGEAAATVIDPGAVAKALDPAEATDTLHWGRNYLWRTEIDCGEGPEAVVVKQFRHDGLRARLRRRLQGTKAEKSFRVARALERAGIGTPAPRLWAESESVTGPAFYVSRFVDDALEARYPIRAYNSGAAGDRYPEWPPEDLCELAAGTARRLHDAGFWHRDFSAGNLLLRRSSPEATPEVFVVDLNRTRRVDRVGSIRRMRDLCRLPLHRREHRRLLLEAYFRGEPPRVARILYLLFHLGFHGRHRFKNRLRGMTDGVKNLLFGRPAYPHLPSAPPSAGPRDRAVWDHLSDQPHQHAGRLEKLAVRVADVPTHATAAAIVVRSAPRILRAYRRLTKEGREREEPVPFDGLGVCVRPHPDRDALLGALDELGVRRVLLRLHPWEEDQDEEEELARTLSARGYELAFSLPQRRELVAEPTRWRRALEELGPRFRPYGRHFVVGQAINRSKWGVWSPGEFAVLADAAEEILRSDPEVEIVGPGVIDFEFHALVTALGWPNGRYRFDATSVLLYVDRRGAPENTQLGFDTEGKAALARAIAEVMPRSAPRVWVTEVNWPLLEGPHAPAGRHVAVDEKTAAAYLVRYYLLALGSGYAERAYWWQLVARGYGLMVAEDGGLRRRPAFRALATLASELGGAELLGAERRSGVRAFRFRRRGAVVVVAWSTDGPATFDLGVPPRRVITAEGEERRPPMEGTVRIDGTPAFFELAGGPGVESGS